MSLANAAAALVLALASAVGAAAPLRYAATVLPEPGHFPEGRVAFVNALGHAVVIGVDVENGTTGTFFWSAATGYRAIREPGGKFLRVRGFNDRDEAVGVSYDLRRGAVWSPGAYRRLEAPAGFAVVEPQSANDRGVVVGALERSTGEMDAFHASANGGIVVDGAAYTFTTFVNGADGVVFNRYAGNCSATCMPLATAYVQDGVATAVLVPGGGGAVVNGLDDAGELAIGAPQLAYWSAAAGFVPLGLSFGNVGGITAAGAIVGNGAADAGTPLAPFIWTKGDGIRWILDLLAPGSPDPGNFTTGCVGPTGIVGGGSSLGPVLLAPVQGSGQ